jgi:uncharacterized protein YyaL (SSP411 family)
MMRTLLALLSALSLSAGPEAKKADPKSADKAHAAGPHDPRNPDGSFKYTNRLAKESSPYLLQHKHNPVDWHPWGDEAFALARKLDRPVFLSIGYSTCHWCHVMERESFADEAIAKILNEKFVCIKVDREERPDVDAVYMNAVRLINGGGGGWPLTVFLTPDRKPFFGGTYFPPEDGPRGSGLKGLAKAVAEVWADPAKRKEIEKDSVNIADAVRRMSARPPGPGDLPAGTADKAADFFLKRFDAEHGGFASGPRLAPKFPRTHVYSWLLRRAAGGDGRVMPIVAKSLDAMARGGIHDHLGGGFHRYSTDRQWLVPHFEKMLYDQALIARTYLDAYQATGDAAHARAARGIFEYVLRDLTRPDGGFLSAEDADSEGVEGRFYVWTDQEIDAVLGAEDGPLFRAFYGVTDTPNFEEAAGSILHVTTPLKEFAEARRLDPADLERRLAAGRAKLLAVRSKRVRPHLDDKVLAGWNGLMIGTMALGAEVLDEPRYLAAAGRAADFVLSRLRRDDGRLLVSWRAGKAGPPAYLDDHAFLADGLVDLYEAAGDPARLRQAVETAEAMIKLFSDPAGGFQFSGTDGEKLIAGNKDAYDGAMPSGNSAAAVALLRLERITGRKDFGDKAADVLKTFAGEVGEDPWSHPVMLSAHGLRTGPTLEIVLAGDPADADLAAMRNLLRRKFVPNRVIIRRPADGPAAEALFALVPWVKDQRPLRGKATAYVCRDRACDLPVHTAEALEKLLDKRGK